MLLTSLTLQNFRSYEKKQLTFSPKTTLILGPNGAGKTNILEAIMMLAVGKSFRADRDREAIQWKKNVSHVTCHVSLGEEKIKLELVLTDGVAEGTKIPMKHYVVNGVPRRQVDFVGNLRAVLFWPEDLELVTDSPSLRRRYLDSVLVQVDREYRRNLFSYERGLRQRNRLLDFINEGKAHRHQLLFWDQLLIRTGSYLTDKRTQYLDFINTHNVSHITYHAHYDKSVISESRLEQYKNEEVAAKATLVGPHRDDFIVQSKEHGQAKDDGFRDLSKFGSRGEQRLSVLWLKLAELSYIENETGIRPLLLLDDILSELDSAHRAIVITVMSEQQTILTSADPDIIKGNSQQWQRIIL